MRVGMAIGNLKGKNRGIGALRGRDGKIRE